LIFLGSDGQRLMIFTKSCCIVLGFTLKFARETGLVDLQLCL